MLDRQTADRRIHEHYEAVWKTADPWSFQNSPFDLVRYRLQLSLLADRRYERALEVGCGAGAFSRMLGELAGFLLAVDVADAAIDRARAAGPMPSSVHFRAQNIMQYDPAADGPWDLVVMSEVIYCLGWLYPLFDVGWLMRQLFEATRPNGRLLLVNTFGHERDFLLHPWLIETYRDLCRNIGYEVKREEVLRGEKEGVEYEVLLTLFEKQAAPKSPAGELDTVAQHEMRR
jgi:SAM-dependent methyltransferase